MMWRLVQASHIVWCQEDYSKTYLGVAFEFLDDSSTGIGLLMENHCTETNFLDEARHCLFGCFIMTMHYEHVHVVIRTTQLHCNRLRLIPDVCRSDIFPERDRMMKTVNQLAIGIYM